MAMLHRSQILLEPEQHQALTQMAQAEGRSISEVVRRIIREYLDEHSTQSQLQQQIEGIEKLTQIRRQLQEQHGIYQGDWLAEARAERTEELARALRNGE